MPTQQIQNNKILWILPAMGYGPNLLYWGEILKRHLQTFPKSIFYSSGERRQIPETNHFVENKLKHLPRVGWLKNRIIALPGFIADIMKHRPELIIISEFGVVPLYVCLARRFIPKTKLLLLVESDSTNGGKQYTGTIQTAIRKFICKTADRIMTNNEAGHSYLHQKLQVPASKIHQAIYMTSEPVTPIKKKQDTSYEQESPKFIFLFVGRLIKLKGLDLLVDAVSQLPPNKQQQLVITIAGNGPEKKILQAQIKKNGVADCFTFAGHIPYVKLADLYQQADAFIFPTRSDYRALVGFEAISYGLPLLHSKWDGAVREVVLDGENGFIVDPYNTASLQQKIMWFLDNRDTLQSFREKSKEIARKYTFDVASANLVEICEQCLKND